MKTINFKIISNKNENIYQYGYVEVPEDVEEMPEWFYYDQNGFAIPRAFTHHDEIGLTQISATDEQESDIEEFNRIIMDEIDFINDAILNAEEDENKKYVHNDITIIVNDGAKFEVEFEDYNSDWHCDYYMAFTLKYNGETVFLDEDVYFQDPYTYEHYKIGEDVLFENGAYIVEIPKGYWEDDEWDGNEIIKEYKTSFKRAYVLSLVRELSVYGIASNIIKLLHSEDPVQAMNEGYIDKFASAWEQDFEDMDVEELYFMSSDDVEKIIKKEL